MKEVSRSGSCRVGYFEWTSRQYPYSEGANSWVRSAQVMACWSRLTSGTLTATHTHQPLRSRGTLRRGNAGTPINTISMEMFGVPTCEQSTLTPAHTKPHTLIVRGKFAQTTALSVAFSTCTGRTAGQQNQEICFQHIVAVKGGHKGALCIWSE